MNPPAHFLQKGQIWEAVADCDVPIQFLFTAPITFSGSVRLAAGERVRVVTEMGEISPAVVSFVPVRYAELHDSLVPQDIRNTPRYKEYLISAEAGYFFEHFRFVRDLA